MTERLFGSNPGSVADGSAVITGLLLGLSLPPGFPMWMAFLGGFFGMAFGKIIFGGLGQNIFNPALVGRAFLQAAFPVAITTWPARAGNWWTLQGDNLCPAIYDARWLTPATAATPLGNLKFGDDPVVTPIFDLFFGTTSGSLGETSALFILTRRPLPGAIADTSTGISRSVFSCLLLLFQASFTRSVFHSFRHFSCSFPAASCSARFTWPPTW